MSHYDITVYLQDLEDLSGRASNVLKQIGVLTLNEFLQLDIQSLQTMRGIGIDTMQEFQDLRNSADSIFDRFYRRKQKIDELCEIMGDIPLERVRIGAKAFNKLRNMEIKTVAQLISLSGKDISEIDGIGNTTRDKIKGTIDDILLKGKDYFSLETDMADGIAVSIPIGDTKGFDFPIIDILLDRFELKSTHMESWYGIKKQSISEALKKRSPNRYENWSGHPISEGELSLLRDMIAQRKFRDENTECIYYSLNDKRGDFVCLFIYADRIRCFFLKDLPRELREQITEARMHQLTEWEFSEEAGGETVYCIKKPYFFPKYPAKFAENGKKRNLSTEEYSVFLTGLPIGDKRMLTDEEIIQELKNNLVNGKVHLSADSNIRNLASRNGYAINDFIALYGFESQQDGRELTEDGARERHLSYLKSCAVGDHVVYFPTDSRFYRIFNVYSYKRGLTINAYLEQLGYQRVLVRPKNPENVSEQDMEIQNSNGSFVEKIFARYPLLGSYMISSKNLEILDQSVKNIIESVLKEPKLKLSLLGEMKIMLLIVNYAKDWNNEETGEFWKYILSRLGYRDKSGKILLILQSSVERSMKMNRRLFIEDETGRGFKSTVVVHALATKKSWMYLFDFLFDFYKENLNWKYMSGDPLLTEMVRSLQQKLKGIQEEDSLSISSTVYSFQEGIRKLILMRPVFTVDLFDRLLSKIDSLINSEEKPVKTYEEQLCEEWFAAKIIAIACIKKRERRSSSDIRNIAIDYSRIQAKFKLKEESAVEIVLPDIRLKNEDREKIYLSVYSDGVLVFKREMSWYGNEIGRTLHAVSIPLGEENIFSMRISIVCGNTVIYDSEDDLYRKALVFSGENEISFANMTKGCYTVIIPQTAALQANCAEQTEMDILQTREYKGYFLELYDGYAITLNKELLAFDAEDIKDIRAIIPKECSKMPAYTMDEREADLAYRDSLCTFIISEKSNKRRYRFLKNGNELGLCADSDVLPEGCVTMTVPLSAEGDFCHIQVIDLESERPVFDRAFALVGHAEWYFNREFYFSDEDYCNAEFFVRIDDFLEKVSFSKNDDVVCVPFRNGMICSKIPKIEIKETTGAWLNGEGSLGFIGNIPHESMLHVENASQASIRFFVDDTDLCYDNSGVLTVGNVLRSLQDGVKENADIYMEATGEKQNRKYLLARVFYRETFLKNPSFWTEDRKLYWDGGTGFVGNPNRTFKLVLTNDGGYTTSFQLQESTQYVELPEEMEIGIYHYEVRIREGSLFKQTEKTIASGDCAIGDKNELRFQNRRICLNYVTEEDKDRHIKIRPCYIDRIKYQGVQNTNEGLCPVYSGVLYALSSRGDRYDFSFDDHTNDRGVTKYEVNPVRIIYLSEGTLSITSPTGEGLYYYYYYNKMTGMDSWELTDREYTKMNESRYALADLYLYQTERMS